MQVAFCISGQFRDEAKSFPAASRLAQQLEAVVFVSTWRRRGTKATGVILEDQAERMFGRDFMKVFPRTLFNLGISEVFPDLQREIAGSFSDVEPTHIRRYFPDAIIDIEDEMMPLTFEEQVYDNNSLKMLYKIWRCNELKRAYEKRHDRKFDLVVRFRPDIVPLITSYQSQEILNSDIEKLLWAPHDDNPDFVHDVFAISSSRIADYYASLFGKAVQSPTRPWRLVHHELASHLAEAGIEVRHIAAAQWLTEDFEQRQKQNRNLLRRLIATGKFRDFDLVDHDFWRELLWLLQDLETVIEGTDSRNLIGDLRTQASAELLNLFPKEVFSLAGLIFASQGDSRSGFLAGFLALITDLKREGARRLQSGDFLDTALSVFKSGIDLGFDSPFQLETLRKALSLDIHDCIRQLAQDYLSLCTEHELQEATGLLQTVLDRIECHMIAFDNALHGGKGLSEAGNIGRRMVEQFPRDWRAFDKMSYLMSASGEPHEALLFAQKALDLDPQSGGLMTRIGNLAREANAISMAEDYLRRAVITWDHEWPWSCLIELLISEKRHSEAQSLITKARERFRDDFMRH